MPDYIVHSQINLEFSDDYYEGLIDVIWQLADILNIDPVIYSSPSLIRAEFHRLSQRLTASHSVYKYAGADIRECRGGC